MELDQNFAVKNIGKYNEIIDPFDSIHTGNLKLPPISPCIRVHSIRRSRRNFSKVMHPLITKLPILSNVKSGFHEEDTIFCSKKPRTPYFLFNKEDIHIGL